ncbi:MULTISPECIES: bifunctional 5,10-methylenetetrahydrofolate dehydrogenase/5,10-methenyltetrahydrofolate cyclohydrolase [Bacteria]|uniref:bifunctional 5,10-methylenetetrahydrofolate dehydrogenase/5,10-methenyltetrahydrofolate cyclohydrolase n=1 Tax=Bacteria TaxID=2 RepID=UPI003F2F9B5A
MKKIECKEISEKIKSKLKEIYRGRKVPVLGIISVGEYAPSKIYVNRKIKEATEIGFENININLEESISLINLKLNIIDAAEKCDGLILQLPLPDNLKEYEDELLNLIPVEKDIDGLHKDNLYNLTLGKNKENILPATVQGILTILEDIGEGNLEGKDVVVIGRGKTVGKPLISVLSNRNATVTLCHSKTVNLEEKTKEADIIISAVGIPHFLKNIGNENSILIDVGISRDINNKIKGDFHPSCYEKCKYYTITPGGTGIMTVTSLLENLHKLFQRTLNETTNK